MGCKESKGDTNEMKVDEEWKKRNLPDIPLNSFENGFEVALYKTLNLIRTDP